MKRAKSVDAELRQLKTALRFLADEWEDAGQTALEEGHNASAASRAGRSIGQSNAHFQAAGALHLLLNMVNTLSEEDEIGPLTVARDVAKATLRKRS